MFKQIIISILLFAFITQVLKGPFILMDYLTNTAAFEKNCVNKNRPLMKCHGKCQMMRQLQAQQSKEQKNIETKLKYMYGSVAFLQILSQNLLFKIDLNNCYLPHKYQFNTHIYFAILHPPQFYFFG